MRATSKAITWSVGDLVNWYKLGELTINENFQRHSVWSPQAKTFFIDSILNQLPLPKIFIRATIDGRLQKTTKDVVDGQQRIRSIVEFADDKFALGSKSESFAGQKYSDLSDEVQKIFLSCSIAIEQLYNATDDDVIDIFARLNSYTVSLNAAEKRHARYQTELKFFVRRMSTKYRWFLEKYGVFTTRQRFRMEDDVFFAELTRLVVEGVGDGGAERIDRFYRDMTDESFGEDRQRSVDAILDETIGFLDSNLGMFFKGPLGRHYQLYGLCAAYLSITSKMPRRPELPGNSTLLDDQAMQANLGTLERELDGEEQTEFKKASSSSTQRIASRLVRVGAFIDALGE
jgi:hypothetical protein